MVLLPDWAADVAHRGAWGACLTDPAVNATHDMGLYEAFFSLVMFFVLRGLDRRAWVPGVQVLLLGAAYAPVRFAMDFLRPESTDGRLWGLTPGQYWSVLLGGLAVWYLVQRMRSSEPRLKPSRDTVSPAEGTTETDAADG